MKIIISALSLAFWTPKWALYFDIVSSSRRISSNSLSSQLPKDDSFLPDDLFANIGLISLRSSIFMYLHIFHYYFSHLSRSPCLSRTVLQSSWRFYLTLSYLFSFFEKLFFGFSSEWTTFAFGFVWKAKHIPTKAALHKSF